jgi:solute carrier family 44 protein 1 (choline transporter-like protein)/choline transporter-like protein 2/4/5
MTRDIETPIIPTVFVFICGLFLTNVFQGSYDITCKTVIQLYLMDCEMFKGDNRFSEKFIQNFMEIVGKIEDSDYKVAFGK